MENQPSHPQHGMGNQGFRPFTAPNMAQQHASSSVDAASAAISMLITAPVQMPVLPYHAESSGAVCTADDGYIWKNLGMQEISAGRLIYYECSQANCIVKKSVAVSRDGQIIETVFRGSHNHPRPSSEMWPRDGLAGYGPSSQGCVLPEAAAGTSMPRAGEGGDHVLSSSDSEEDNEGEPTADGDICSNANDTERGALVPVQRSIGQMASHNLGGSWQHDANSHQCKRRRSKSSKVWHEFTSVLSGGDVQGAQCNHCKKCLSGKSTGGTSHLRRHLKTCPARPSTGWVQQQRPSSQPNSSVEKNSNFDQEKSLELLTKALVSNLCYFSLTSSTNYRQFLAGICPTYDVVSQSAIGEKFLSIFQNEKLKLMEEISLAPGGVFLTVSKWDLDSNYFICVKAHFIDKAWNVIRKIVRCSFAGSKKDRTDVYISMFPHYESYKNVSNWDDEDEDEYEYEDMDDDKDKKPDPKGILKEVVQNYSLHRKLLGISFPKSLDHTDIWCLHMNLSERTYSLIRNNNLLSLHCIVDSLHGIVCYDRSLLRFKQLREDWFRYMTGSPMRREKYKEILSQLQINKPSFCSQKWYLAFYFLEAALQFDKVLPNPEQIDSIRYPSKPSDPELQATEDFCNIARLIYHAIKVASSPYNGTLNSVFHPICRLKIALTTASTKGNTYKILDLERMQKKFDEFWKKWYQWLSLAVILDPRYKIWLLDFYLKESFGSDATKYTSEVRGKIYELFFRYKFLGDQQRGERLNDSNADLHLDTVGHGTIPAHDSRQSHSEQSVHEEIGELNQYLEGERIPENVPFDILKWWKDNASTYPTLARMAQDILAIPVSGISAESAFDKTDERVNLFSRKLGPEEVEALICTQDWIKSSEINNDEVCGSTNKPA
ncbi:unnamed protein product [Urochloa humidicola]